MTKPYLTTFLTITAVVFLTSIGRTQNSKHNILINFGGYSGYGYPDKLGSRNSGEPPTVSLGTEYTFNKLLSAGLYGAYSYIHFKFDYPGIGYKDVWYGWDVGLRSTFHISPLFIKNEKVDIYLAAFSGYTTRSLVYDKSNIYRDDLNYNVDAFSIGGIAGFRYLVNESFGFYAEAGLSRKFFMGGGLSFKINTKK